MQALMPFLMRLFHLNALKFSHLSGAIPIGSEDTGFGRLVFLSIASKKMRNSQPYCKFF